LSASQPVEPEDEKFKSPREKTHRKAFQESGFHSQFGAHQRGDRFNRFALSLRLVDNAVPKTLHVLNGASSCSETNGHSRLPEKNDCIPHVQDVSHIAWILGAFGQDAKHAIQVRIVSFS
jgi:hypothetical protein